MQMTAWSIVSHSTRDLVLKLFIINKILTIFVKKTIKAKKLVEMPLVEVCKSI